MNKSKKFFLAVKLEQRSCIDRRQKKIEFDGSEDRKNSDRRLVLAVVREWSMAVDKG